MFRSQTCQTTQREVHRHDSRQNEHRQKIFPRVINKSPFGSSQNKQDMETTVERTDARQVGSRNQLTAEQQVLIAETEALLAKGDRMMEEDVNDIREKLGNLPEIINLSAVARKCFGKSRTWLYQRINGNKVNGKPAYFTRAERKQLLDFLHGLGNDLLAIKLV